MSDVDYNQPVYLDNNPDPRPCPTCGKSQNPNFVPFCDCTAWTLKPSLTGPADESV